MDIIPVIDIFNGKVVTAIQGKRDSYQPVDLKLYNTIDPIEIINILIKRFKPSIIYIADLNGILYKNINLSMYDFIIRNNPKIKFWVDFGKTDIHKLQKYQNLDRVFCSETSKGFDLSSNKNNCKICSLDYRGNILGNVTLRKQKRYLPKKIILMDLSQVGSTKNMSFSLVRKYLKFKDKHDIYIAGGLKSTLDLNRAKFLGIKGVLATSIFIKQRIPKLYITKEKTNLKK